MSRNLSKWSQDSTYEEYKASKDYESWIYIKLPQARSKAPETCPKEYAKTILPIMKKLYTLLEPEYNPTLIFYLDKYEKNVYTNENNEDFNKPVHRVEKNAKLVWLDLSKFNNYLDWTEHDIESEIAIISEDYFITAWKKANGME